MNLGLSFDLYQLNMMPGGFSNYNMFLQNTKQRLGSLLQEHITYTQLRLPRTSAELCGLLPTAPWFLFFALFPARIFARARIHRVSACFAQSWSSEMLKAAACWSGLVWTFLRLHDSLRTFEVLTCCLPKWWSSQNITKAQ